MRRNKIWLVLLSLSLLAASPVRAQGIPTGTLTGRVSDEQGGALPGVGVSITSPALQGGRTAVTNVNGNYTFLFLPPGDYTVNFALSGFQPVALTKKVAAGQEIAADARLVLAGVTSAMVVTAQSEAVSTTSQATTTYSADVLDKLPVTRTMLSSVVLSPGVNQNGPNGAVTISGAMSFDSVFNVNGVNVQDNLRGTPTSLFIEDAIQETSTMTSGVSAEYGRFTGGVVNAVTKRGGNDFSGSFRMTENNDDTKAQTPIPTTYTDKWVPTYEGTLGGPIWKDTVWFFGAVRYNKQETSSSTAAVTPGGPTTTIPQTNQNDRYEGKLTISPLPNHTLTGEYTWTTTHSTNYAFPNLPILDASPTFLYNRELPSDLLAFNYTGVLTSDLFLEGNYSKKTFTFINAGGTDTSLIGGTAGLSQANGLGQFYSPIFCGVCSPETRNNKDFSAKGTYFLSAGSLGTHSVSFGYQNFQSMLKANNYQSGSSWLLYATSVSQVGGNLYPVIDANSYLLYAPIPELSQGSDLQTQSVFVNDAWKLGSHLSFNVGVRYDKNHAIDSGGHLVANDSQYSPRLAAAYDVKGDGTFRVTGSYARYVGQIQEGIAGSGASPAGAPGSYYYFWQGPSINLACPPACTPTSQVLQQMYNYMGVSGTGMLPTNATAGIINLPGINQRILSPLSSPNANEYSIGLGGAVGSNLVYRVDAIRREFADFYALSRNLSNGHVSDALGNEYDLGVYINSNAATRNYTALNTSLSYRWNSLTVGGNWTWSHTIGNFVGENTGSGPLAYTGLNYPEYVQASWNTPKGDLSQDERHRVRLYANYDFKAGPVSISPGLLQSIDTGTPYGASGSIRSYPYVDPNLACSSAGQTNCYVSPPTTVTYYFTSRDAYRTPTVSQTDISLNIAGKIGPVEVFVMPQILNLFNGQTVTLINNSTGINTSVFAGQGTTPDSRGLVRFDPFTTAPIQCPQADSAAQCAAIGANWKLGPSFGKPVSGSSTQPSFQIPRQWLVTFGARF